MTPQPEIPKDTEMQIVNALLYPQDHSEERLELLGLSHEDVWGQSGYDHAEMDDDYEIVLSEGIGDEYV